MSTSLAASSARPTGQPTPENPDLPQTRRSPHGENGRNSPRMHQPAANASTEDDGMDVDVASDDEQSGEAQTGGRKR